VTDSSRRTPRRLLAVLGVVVLLLGAFLAGVLVGGHPRATGITSLPPPVRDALLGSDGNPTVDEVLEILEDGYYTEVDAERLDRASVDAMLKVLEDPYTFYLDPDEYAELQREQEGILFGVGMTVQDRDGRVVVTGVYPDSPAQRAGVRAGDVIASVEGTSTAGLELGEVVRRVRGPEGTTVRIRFVRPGDGARDLTLTRARIKVPVVTSRVERAGGEKIGYVKLSEFDRGAGRQLRKAVADLDREGVSGIVLDLRGDPGGLVDEAVAATSVFLDNGSPVVTIEGLHRDETTLRTEGRAVTDLPLVVLVDRSSASASEIVAGALRDDGRATIVGTRTFGKALVQTTRRLRNGGALRYTSARYTTPKGIDINKRGLQPDVRAEDDPATPADEALRRALAVAAAGRGS
jgi:carboxyl-terminal processing protease